MLLRLSSAVALGSPLRVMLVMSMNAWFLALPDISGSKK